MGRTLWFLIETIGQILATACLLRAYMHWLGVAARDPIGQFVIAVTDWFVKPLRQLLPGSRNFDWASLCAALITTLVMAVAFVFLAGMTQAPVFGAVLMTAVYWLIKWSLYLMIIVVIGRAILSWVNPHAPIAPTLEALSDPVMRPVRKWVPLIGGMDLSPLVLIIGLQLLIGLVASLFAPMVLVQ